MSSTKTPRAATPAEPSATPKKPRPKSPRKLYAEHVANGFCRFVDPEDGLCPEQATAVPVIAAAYARACDAAEGEGEMDWSANGDRMCPTHAAVIAEMWLGEMWHPTGEPDGLFVDRHGTEWWSPLVTVALVGAAPRENA